MTTSNSSKGLKGLIAVIVIGAMSIGFWGISQQPNTPVLHISHEAGPDDATVSVVDATSGDATPGDAGPQPAPPATGTAWVDAQP